MAKIPFNTAPQQGNTAQERVSEQVKAAVTAYRAMLDAFVNNPTRRTDKAFPVLLVGSLAVQTLSHQDGACGMSQSSVLEPRRASSGAKTGRHMLSSLVRTIEIWLIRRHGRQELNSLDDEQLKDVGISREDALREASKPFWRA